MTTVFSVYELTLSIKKLLEKQFTSVAVKGEISNLKEQSSGHIYFTLKDKDSQIQAVFFRGDATKSLKRPMKNGDEILVRGELNVYPPRGNYQIIVRELEFAGIGELLLQLHQLKKTLETRGWFDTGHKKALPKHPQVIGVITSPTGAVIQDIVNVLSRRFSGFKLLLNPVKVQGDGAAQEIARAIDEMNRHQLADVLIVGRGGGSLEDLWAFNEEIVAEAIFRSQIPIVTAIGHETDTCIADFVADLRAPTPSAAAEIVTKEKAQKLDFLQSVKRILANTLYLKTKEERAKWRGFAKQPLFSSPSTLLAAYFQKIDESREDLDSFLKTRLLEQKLHFRRIKETLALLNPAMQIREQKGRLQTLDKSMHQSSCTILLQKRERLERLEKHLMAINPKNLLTKGYCILFRENTNSVIVSTQDVVATERLDVLLQDGTLKVQRIP
jgi:exodeoxyribonuclease VII large subunit